MAGAVICEEQRLRVVACHPALRLTHDRAPEMLAVRSTRLGLIPHSAAEPSNWIVLFEGRPDMISARSHGLPAIAVPGDDDWEPEWRSCWRAATSRSCSSATALAARRPRGSRADLKAAGVRGGFIDLSHATAMNGYDLTEWLHDRAIAQTSRTSIYAGRWQHPTHARAQPASQARE